MNQIHILFPDTEPSVQLEESKTISTSDTTENTAIEVESRILDAEAPKPEVPSSDETPELPETKLNGEGETENVQELDPKPVETLENPSQ